MTKTYRIAGMGCNHCKVLVEKAIASLPGCTGVKVNLNDSVAIVTGAVRVADVIKAVALAGFVASEINNEL